MKKILYSIITVLEKTEVSNSGKSDSVALLNMDSSFGPKDTKLDIFPVAMVQTPLLCANLAYIRGSS